MLLAAPFSNLHHESIGIGSAMAQHDHPTSPSATNASQSTPSDTVRDTPRFAPTLARSEWQLRTRSIAFRRTPLLMGILNVTPDSFWDGGKYFTSDRAVDRALRMEDEGADILDIGGESTRPYSQAVSESDERDRIEAVMQKLSGRVNIPISIDTTKASVAALAIDLGAEIINDVSGLEADPDMISVATKSKAALCAMHMQGTPQTMQDNPTYQDVVVDIYNYLAQRDRWLIEHGIEPEKICLDPGIGFGKTHEHNLELLRKADVFHGLGRPILVGHSQKGFIAKIIGRKDVDRTHGTVGVSLALALRRIQILRIHDVVANKQAIDLFAASGGLD